MAGAGGEWRRSWWIAFTLVPFGWLAFVAFGYAGRRARRRDWIVWALVYGAVFWTATVIASVEELDYGMRQTGGMVMFFGTPIPFLHALAIRRAYLDAADRPVTERVSADGRGGDAPPRDAGPRTTRPRRRRWGVLPVLMVLAGVFGVLTGGAAVASGDLVGVGFLAFGAASIVAATLRAPARADAVPAVDTFRDTGETGLVFRYAAGRARRATAVTALFVVVGVVMAVSPEDFSGRRRDIARPAGVLAAVAAAATVASGANGRPGGVIALTPSRLANVSGKFRAVLAWDSVADVRAATGYGGEAIVAVDATHADAVEASFAAGFVTRFVRRAMGNLALDPQAVEVEPAALLAVVRHYWEHPEDRRELGTKRALERFEELARGEGSRLRS